MPRRDSELRQSPTSKRDVRVQLPVALLAGLGAGRQQSELLELAREAGVDPRPFAQRLEVELSLGLHQAGAPPLPVAGTGRGKLLADDAQREELVALQPQDRLEALDVVLAEEPIPALRPPGRQQPLILQIANLRDRDVGELVLEHPAEGSDRQQTRSRGGRRHRLRNVSRYLPICSSSPSSSCADSTRFRFTNVPLRLP